LISRALIIYPLTAWCLSAALLSPKISWADELDALALESAPTAQTPATASPTRIFFEAAAGQIGQRYGLPDLDTHRLSLDLNHKVSLGQGWRAVLSNRTDQLRPAGVEMPSTLNSLRQAYVGWQDETGSRLIELGRINLRHGTAYGYSPTDIFRDGSLRAVTTADPLAQRENRLGTFMLRTQYIGAAGTVALALAPKLSSQPSNERFSIDAGATNNRHRSLLTFSSKYSDRLNGQALLAHDEVRGTQWGANMTALLSDAVVVHAEWLRGRDQVLWMPGSSTPHPTTRNRAAAGLTFSSTKRLSLTVEVQYNGFAPSDIRYAQAAPAVVGGNSADFLIETQRRQEIASRQAYMVYVAQRDLFKKGLDLTALLRVNADDHSRLTWLELRHHWPKVDVALQWQHLSGRAASEFGVLPYRQSLQILGAYYF
jgi:hypothetical protein